MKYSKTSVIDLDGSSSPASSSSGSASSVSDTNKKDKQNEISIGKSPS
jgi:hypothetical protein